MQHNPSGAFPLRLARGGGRAVHESPGLHLMSMASEGGVDDALDAREKQTEL